MLGGRGGRYTIPIGETTQVVGMGVDWNERFIIEGGKQ